MNNFCHHCGAPLYGPVCGSCGRPDHHPAAAQTPAYGMPVQAMPGMPAPTQHGKRGTIIAAVAVTVLVLGMISTVFLVWHPFSTHNTAKPAARQATSAPRTVISVQPPPSTVIVTRPAPRRQLSSGDSYSGGGYSTVDADPSADVYDCSLAGDGTHLTATVWVQNNAARPLDVLGTLSFTGSDGTWLGEGGFSAAALDSGDSIDTYVDTGDPNDPNADQVSDPSYDAYDMTCTVTSLRTKTP